MHHIAADAFIFKNYHAGSAMQVQIADGEHFEVKGSGDVEFDTDVDGVRSKIVLQNLLHVPDMTAKNFVSVSQMTKMCAQVSFREHVARCSRVDVL
jgi:hypothetical protein